MRCLAVLLVLASCTDAPERRTVQPPPATCTNQCPAAGSECSTDSLSLRTCATGSLGCLEWSAYSPCGASKKCVQGACVVACSPSACTVSARRCGTTGGVQTCTAGIDGCGFWGTAVTCPGGGVCVGAGTCQCTDQCALGSKRCSGNGVQTCILANTGCSAWSVAASCLTGDSCTDGVCIPPDPCGGVPATGSCRDSEHAQYCVRRADGVSEVEFVTCPAGDACFVEAGGAVCRSNRVCAEGATRCTSSTGLETCTSNAWVASSCSPNICTAGPLGARCGLAGGAGRVTGRLFYQAPAYIDLGGYGPMEDRPAPGVLCVVSDDTGVIGSAYTGLSGADAGKFTVPLSRALTASAFISYNPLWLRDDGTALLGVADASTDNPDSLTAEYFSGAGERLDGRTDLGGRLLSAPYSGSFYIYEWAAASLRLEMARRPGVAFESLAYFWAPGQDPSCGGCYMRFGAAVGTRTFQNAIQLSGTVGNEHHFQTYVILHEFGHYVAHTQSRDDNTGGQHSLQFPSPPPMAWSEGWASLSGQINYSVLRGGEYPRAYRVDDGTAFYTDVEKVSSAAGDIFPRPTMDGGLTQNLSEFIVTAIGWDLWDASSAGEVWDVNKLGDGPITAAMSSTRIKTVDRGAVGTDLADFLDALRCTPTFLDASKLDFVPQRYFFPYTGGPLCP